MYYITLMNISQYQMYRNREVKVLDVITSEQNGFSIKRCSTCLIYMLNKHHSEDKLGKTVIVVSIQPVINHENILM